MHVPNRIPRQPKNIFRKSHGNISDTHPIRIRYCPSPKCCLCCVSVPKVLTQDVLLPPACCWCHHHMAQLQRRLSQSEHVLFSSFFFCYSYLYARTTIQQRAQQQVPVWHDRPACEVAGALHGIQNGAKMWSMFAVRANVLKFTIRF